MFHVFDSDDWPFAGFILLWSCGMFAAVARAASMSPWWGMSAGILFAAVFWLDLEATEARWNNRVYGPTWEEDLERSMSRKK